MNGGYAIPEFGLAYVRNIRIFRSLTSDDYRTADLLVSACYCLNGRELYPNPINLTHVTLFIPLFNKTISLFFLF